MGHSWYSSLVLIDPSSDITIGDVCKALKAFYADNTEGRKTSVQEKNDTIILSFDDYHFHIHKSSMPHVLAESEEIAVKFGKDRQDKDRISLCQSRFETSADPDLDMEYFNDFLLIGEAISKLGKVYRFDQNDGKFMDEP